MSVGTASVLAAVWLACALARRRRPSRWVTVTGAFAREFTAIMLLLGLWQYVGAFVHTRVAGAMERGRHVASLEAAMHLPSERAVQHVLLAVPRLSEAADVYYAYAHLNGTALFVVWLWWRHRPFYPRARFVIITSTLACLLVQSVPVAPPRLLPDLGFVDTALRDGHSVYGEFGAGMSNQLAAMPSVHVAWAVIVGWYVFWAVPRRWRWLGPLHTVLTVLVVVGTANHWWLDGLVGAGFVALAMLAGWGAPRLWRRGARGPAPVPARAPEAEPGMARIPSIRP